MKQGEEEWLDREDIVGNSQCMSLVKKHAVHFAQVYCKALYLTPSMFTVFYFIVFFLKFTY